MDDRRAELVRLRREGRTTTRRGGVLVALVPVVLAGGIWSVLTLGPILGTVAGVLTMLYTFAGGLTGLFMCGYGIADQRRSRRELAALAELHQLPEARIVRG